jgi:hypothetical protein
VQAGWEVTRKSALPQRLKRLVEILQRVNYGTIHDLQIRAGEPVLDSPLKVIRQIKMGAENGPRAELSSDDFALKAQHIEFFAQLRDIGDGRIAELEVKHGLPFMMAVEEDLVA